MMNSESGVFTAAVITVCLDPDTAERVVQAVEKMPWLVTASNFEAYISASRRPYIGPQLKAADACIAIVDFDQRPEEAVETTKYLQQVFPGKITVIALAQSREPELLLLAMRGGCTEFLHKPLKMDAFQEVLRRLERQWTATTARTAPVGSVLSFFGAKGGVGTTTLAVHLAMYLVQCHGKRTLLIDNHAELGHISVYLGIDGSRYHFAEVVRNVSRLDSELLQGFVAKHSSGLEILSSPDVCGNMNNMDPDAIARTLEFLKTEYDFVILDCATAVDENALAVIDVSTRVYLVATPEIGAIRDLARYVDNLMQIDYTTEKMHVVINRFSSRYAVSVEQIEKAIRLPIAIRLPNSYTELVRSVNLGEPVSAKTKSDFAAQVVKWSNTLVGSRTAAAQAPPQQQKKSSFVAMWM
jgi:pilus assembly protein CpaE